jgi:hypothetical protein
LERASDVLQDLSKELDKPRGNRAPPKPLAIDGSQPALTPPELVYQRMLAGDPVEAAEQAQKFLKERPLIAYYEEVLIGGLKLADADAKRGLLVVAMRSGWPFRHPSPKNDRVPGLQRPLPCLARKRR